MLVVIALKSVFTFILRKSFVDSMSTLLDNALATMFTSNIVLIILNNVRIVSKLSLFNKVIIYNLDKDNDKILRSLRQVIELFSIL